MTETSKNGILVGERGPEIISQANDYVETHSLRHMAIDGHNHNVGKIVRKGGEYFTRISCMKQHCRHQECAEVYLPVPASLIKLWEDMKLATPVV